MTPAPEPPRASRAALVLGLALAAGFVVAFSARPAIVLSHAEIDDALFMRLGLQLATGHWLGHYTVLTLAKGPGFPLFLAAVSLSGLPYPLALGLFHAACAGFAAWVAARLTRSPWTGLAMLAALLLAPVLYNGELLGLARDAFYMSLTLAFAAAAIATTTGCCGAPRRMAALTGVLGAWVWLTREEGVWLLPLVTVLLAAAFVVLAVENAPRGIVRALAPAALALGVAAALVVSFGLINWAVYGRFVINEIKDRAFQGALTALQDASAPFHKEGVPVPAAARARIYAASPAFAELKEPILDGPMQADATQWGCRENRNFCGDFGGGWFFWSLRNTAAARGYHETPAKAAVFYRRLAREVRQACADGRLQCRHWPVPLVPPMKASELGDVGRSFARVFHVTTFGEPVGLEQGPSDLTAPDAEAFVALLNLTASQQPGPTALRRFTGWFAGDGAQWFSLQATAPVQVAQLAREPSPDLVTHFRDPRVARQRFTLAVACPTRAPCPVVFAADGAAAVPIDFARLGKGAHPVAGGTLYIDSGGDPARALLRTRISDAWLTAAARLDPLFRGLVLLGGAGWLLLALLSLVRRRITVGFLVCTGLLASVLARAVILSLIDALSFVAASHGYALAGAILLVMFSVLVLAELAAALKSSAAA